MAGHDIGSRPITTMATGQELSLTVHTFRGGAGPTVLLLGGIHGDEAAAVASVRHIIDHLDGAELHGTVIAVPVCNPLAYEAMTRHTPQDGLNLNRIFPGDPAGSVTEQIAASLTELIRAADFVIDYHSSGLYSTVSYAYLHEPARALAEAYGTDFLFHHDPFPGSATGIALAKGTPALLSELGGGGSRTTEFVAQATAGTDRVLAALGVQDGDGARRTDQRVLRELTVLRPRCGGLMETDYPTDQIGETIAQGTVIGRVISPYTSAVLEELHAPYDPTILILSREPLTRNNPGDYGYMVGNGATVTSTADLWD